MEYVPPRTAQTGLLWPRNRGCTATLEENHLDLVQIECIMVEDGSPQRHLVQGAASCMTLCQYRDCSRYGEGGAF
jgi:hypothetical protein